MKATAIPQNSQEAKARKVSVMVIRLGQIGGANNASRLTKPIVTQFGSSGRIQSAENGPAKIEYQRLNKSEEKVNVFMATSIQSPVVANTKKIAARTNTRRRFGSDEWMKPSWEGLVLSSVIVFDPKIS